jgi:DUF4097 and DUF4098 domain-containing protein YvlB
LSARKIGFLILVLVFGATVEIAWQVREHHYSFGPEGLRVLGGRFYGPSFEFEETAERALSAEGAAEVEVGNAFGEVRVIPGEEAVVRVRLRKVVFQPTEEKAQTFARRVEVEIAEDEDRLRVGTNREDVEGGEEVGFETHLEVQVPPDTRARVRNEHGAVEVRGVASATVRSAFDRVRVEDVEGPVSIDARQGSVEVSGLGAGLNLESRHGDVEVTEVAGTAELDVQHGKLRVRGASQLKARLSYGDVEVEDVSGDAVVHARHAEVRASGVTGRAELRTTFADVRSGAVGGSLQVEVEHGDAHLAPGAPITQTIDVTASQGEITLAVPEGSRFELAAESRHGEVSVDVAGLDSRDSTAGESARVEGTMGGGGAQVTLRARGDVLLEPGSASPPAEQE